MIPAARSPATLEALQADVARAGPIVAAARALGGYLALAGGLLCFAVPLLAWSMCASALHRVLPRARGKRFGQYMLMVLFRSFLSVMRRARLLHLDLSALDALRNDAPLVIAPNHPSLLDAVLVISRLPNVVCIMKSDLGSRVLFGGGSRLASYIHNDSPVALVRGAAAAARAGSHVLIFPEGTRTRGTSVNPFKGGFALVGKVAKVPIQTVFIESNSPFLGKGWPLSRRPAFPLVYRVRLGRRFEIGASVHGSMDEIERYFHSMLAAPGSAPGV